MEFSKEKNQTKSKIFSKRYFLVLFFLLFLVITFFPTHHIDAVTWESNADYNKRVYDTNTSATKNEPQDESCSLFNLPRCFLLVIFHFAGFLLSLSSSLFAWIIDTNNIKYLISDNTALYSSWTFVRDILNMAFIMVLLFSAFCTIFQIEQYNYKKLLWKIVLMALLVNFSFPIARFIIDVSNILMYTLINNLFGASGTGAAAANSFGIITKGSGLDTLMTSGGAVGISNITLLANAIMIFMLAITFLAIGILLLIRLIALAILIVLSPIAFVGSIMPGVSSYASQWWNDLFKYSFFGPIMIFGVSIAVKLMTDTANMDRIRNLSRGAVAGQTATDPTFLGQIGIIAIPIVLLWMVMGIAQKLSIVGAGAVMGGAQKVMKGAGKKFSGFNAIKRQYDSYAGERKKRQAEKNKDNFGGGIGKTFNKWQDTAIGAMPVGGGAARKRVEETERRAVQEQREEWKKQGGADETQLDAALGSRNSAKRKAAAMEMAEKNGFGDGTNRAADLARYQKAADAVKGDRVNEKAFKDKVEEKHIRLIIEDDIARGGKTKPQAYDDNLKNMNADALSKQRHLLDQNDFHDNFFQAKKTTDPRFIQEVAKKINTATRLDWKRAVPNRDYKI